MRPASFFFLNVLVAGISLSSCSQSNSPKTSPSDLFVGSTPCDSVIKSTLQIKMDTKCDFIKWELTIDKSKSTFHIDVLYGESKPNTNGFMGGGQKIVLNGKYTIVKGVGENPGLNVYQLKTEKPASPIRLIEMDSNVLHFADNNNKLLVGNGGWGYMLNRIKE